jgi:hypothetical protein
VPHSCDLYSAVQCMRVVHHHIHIAQVACVAGRQSICCASVVPVGSQGITPHTNTHTRHAAFLPGMLHCMRQASGGNHVCECVCCRVCCLSQDAWAKCWLEGWVTRRPHQLYHSFHLCHFSINASRSRGVRHRGSAAIDELYLHQVPR